mgnify:FL=1
MPRAKRGFKARRRRNRVLKLARGYYGARSRQFRSAVSQVRHAWKDAFAARRVKKRNFRKLWITRINAGARQHGVTYSKLINALKNKDIQIDRKVLADLAMNEPAGFKAVIDATR